MGTTHSQKRNTLLNQLAKMAPVLRAAQKEAATSQAASAKDRRAEAEARFDQLLRELETNRRLVQGERPGQAGMFD